MYRFIVASMALIGLTVGSVSAGPPSPGQTIQNSIEILKDLSKDPLKGIPPSLIADAQGIAIIPNVVKVGFVFAGRGGHGLVMTRDKEGHWGEPVFVDLGGASVGFQIGVESTDVVLIFRKRKSLDRILEGKNKLTLGADAAIAAGPVGRNVAAATDAKLEAEIMSYSRSRGLFAGVALDGAVIDANNRVTEAYARDVRPELRKLSDALRIKLTEMAIDLKADPILGPVVKP
ncbi:lipid-binding SYLF domain-containing protein [Telmatocola sphagniphila]|uniref:Lipid-binding SYLF domain-containing protein n=1 Tax=Telmatocola sphagniphila TaxID=1123043 RepID=A0A8E6BAY8_9BACT|nr:lipid-binding SYLF domain-containing protein [Telmatocola sphagniphila]QVL34524.1 lipid-binding SYLF domain-containing protein [Telmatocola sphagniphila]